MSHAGERCESCSINWIAVALLGIVLPVAVIAVTALLVTTQPRAPQGDTPEAVAQRIGIAAAPAKPTPAAPGKAEEKAKAETKPAGKEPAKPAAKAEAKPEAKPEDKPAAATAGSDKGKAVYTANCAACHAAGVAGAPKFGDKAAWASRIKEGNAALHGTAIKGIRAMPPKGGNASLPNDDVKAAVDYMVAAAK